MHIYLFIFYLVWGGHMWRPEEAVGFPGAGIAGGWELPEVGTENTTSSPPQLQESFL